MTALDFGGTRQARTAVRAMNRVAGVSALAEHAMLAGAMLGWHGVMADPVYLSANDRRFNCVGREGAAPRVGH